VRDLERGEGEGGGGRGNERGAVTFEVGRFDLAHKFGQIPTPRRFVGRRRVALQ